MAALTLDPADLERLAQDIVREMAQVREVPTFISEDQLAERWPWASARVLQKARTGSGWLYVKGRRVRLPEHVSGARRVAYWLARRPGVRSVLDVEDEICGWRKSA